MTILITTLLIINLLLVAFLLFKQSVQKKDEERLERLIREEASGNRQELSKSFESFTKQFILSAQGSEQKLEKIRETVDSNLKSLQQDSSQKLEKMRETVDEKLHATLERRLGESFKVVSDRLELVHKGLGEMQTLANGVGDLKKVLTNVKTRGTWGEIQLGALLEQMLTPDQYEKNIATKKNTRDPVEFAIKCPGKEGHPVYIPIDAKFPKEDYERLLQAQEEGNLALVEESSKAIETRIKLEAKKIKDKYIDPPFTTDFGILYLPTEGLYAEALRRPGLFDHLQRECRVIITGPMTISAILNSLQMGFRTLAVEKRAGDVWNLLGTVKAEFGKFGDILDKTQEKLRQASDEIEKAASKSRNIEKKLKDVQGLPQTPDVTLIEEPKQLFETSS
jgi:DNA recombination protein RmuC